MSISEHELLQKLVQIFKVTKKVKKSDVANFLTISEEELFKYLISWGQELPIKIKEDFVVIKKMKKFKSALKTWKLNRNIPLSEEELQELASTKAKDEEKKQKKTKHKEEKKSKTKHEENVIINRELTNRGAFKVVEAIIRFSICCFTKSVVCASIGIYRSLFPFPRTFINDFCRSTPVIFKLEISLTRAIEAYISRKSKYDSIRHSFVPK